MAREAADAKDPFAFSLTDKGWMAIEDLLQYAGETPRHKLAFIRTTMSQYTVYFGCRPDYVICGVELWEDLIFAWSEEQREYFQQQDATPICEGLPKTLCMQYDVAIIDGIILVKDLELPQVEYYLASTTEFQRMYFGRNNRHVVDVCTGELIKESNYIMRTFPDFTVRVFEDISKEALHALMLKIIKGLLKEMPEDTVRLRAAIIEAIKSHWDTDAGALYGTPLKILQKALLES